MSTNVASNKSDTDNKGATHTINRNSNTNSQSLTTVTVTNKWTGKGNNYNWNDANNWSLGVPTNNQILEIDITNVEPTSTGATPTFQNDMSNLVINKLVIDGKTNSSSVGGFDIKGNLITITNGIENAVEKNYISDIPMPSSQIFIKNQINFNGNSIINVTGDNMLTFVPADSNKTMDLGSNKVQFAASGGGSISVNHAIVGTGEIIISDNAASDGSVGFMSSSPNFNGKVKIGSGNIVGVRKQGSATTSAFGNSSIEIKNGGAIKLIASGTKAYNIDNDITMSGKGATSSNSNTGQYTGAISACITSAQAGCDAGVQITLSGKITLTGDTELGASYNSGTAMGAGAPTSTTATYTIRNLITNGHNLTAVPGSMVVIQK